MIPLSLFFILSAVGVAGAEGRYKESPERSAAKVDQKYGVVISCEIGKPPHFVGRLNKNFYFLAAEIGKNNVQIASMTARVEELEKIIRQTEYMVNIMHEGQIGLLFHRIKALEQRPDYYHDMNFIDEPPTIEWGPCIQERDPHKGDWEDFWLTDCSNSEDWISKYQIGFRSDGSVVWKEKRGR